MRNLQKKFAGKQLPSTDDNSLRVQATNIHVIEDQEYDSEIRTNSCDKDPSVEEHRETSDSITLTSDRNSVLGKNYISTPFNDEGVKYRKFFVGGLSYKTTTASLRNHFERFGPVEDCLIIIDRKTGGSKGYGFVLMRTKDGASAVIRNPYITIEEKRCNVNLAYLGARHSSAVDFDSVFSNNATDVKRINGSSSPNYEVPIIIRPSYAYVPVYCYLPVCSVLAPPYSYNTDFYNLSSEDSMKSNNSPRASVSGSSEDNLNPKHKGKREEFCTISSFKDNDQLDKC